MKVRTRAVLLVLSLILPEAGILGSIGYYSILAATRFSDALTEISSSLDGVRRLSTAMADLRAAVPGPQAAPSGSNPEFHARFATVRAELESCSTASCHSSPMQPRQMVDRLRPILERVRQEADLLSDEGGAARQERIATIHAGIDQVEAQNEGMVRALAVRVRDMQERSRAATQKALWLMLWATLGVGLVGIGVAYWATRALTRPIQEMAEATDRIGRGQEAPRLPRDRRDELGVLARSLESMAVELGRRQAELLNHQSRLEAEVQARTQELRRKEDALRRSERMATLGLISSSIAHELNNPLTGLIMNAHLLAEAVPADSPQGELVASIREAANRTKNVVEQIRAMARGASQERVACDMRHVVERALELVRPLLDLRRIRVARDEPDSPPAIEGVPDRLLQLVLNLVVNAVEAMADDGTLRVGLYERADRCVLEVEDTGVGIPVHLRGSVFREMFTTKERGVGLGLLISGQIIEEHQATVEVDSRTAQEAAVTERRPGTCIRVAFPVWREREGTGR